MKRERIIEILACPRCQGDVLVEKDRGKITCKGCWTAYRFEGEIPIMLPDPEAEARAKSAPEANPYAPGSRELIERRAGGLVLDDGAGNGKEAFPHVVQLEMYLSPTTDVVGDALALPFRAGSFDAVISEAVIEHVKDPFRYIGEIRRVLKEGGEVRIDAPFLHPYHAVPHHFFNMTRSGLELLLSDFDMVQSGVGPHQEPWVALRDILEIYQAALKDDDLRERFLRLSLRELLQTLQDEDDLPFLRGLKPELIEYISAGVYFHGLKPSRRASPRPKRKSVSVVITGRDPSDRTQECLRRVTDVRYPSERLEVIVVATGSDERSVEEVRQHFPRAKVIRPPRDVGIPGARMAGAREATGDRLAFLDAECRIDADWLEGLTEPMEANGNVVCTAAPMIDSQNGGFRLIPGSIDFLGRPVKPEASTNPRDPDSPSGPTISPLGEGMLIDREVFFRVGGFDTDFHARLDDLDLGWRLWVLGYQVHHAPGAPIVQVREDAGLDPARLAYLSERNTLLSLYKNLDDENLERILPLAILLGLQRGWSTSEISTSRYMFDSPADDDSGEMRISKLHAAHLLAVDGFLHRIGQAHRRREVVQRARRRPDREILPLFRIPAEDGSDADGIAGALIRSLGVGAPGIDWMISEMEEARR